MEQLDQEVRFDVSEAVIFFAWPVCSPEDLLTRSFQTHSGRIDCRIDRLASALGAPVHPARRMRVRQFSRLH